MRKPTVDDLKTQVGRSKFFFGQHEENNVWSIHPKIIATLDFDKFDITWANCPSDSTPIKRRFENSDSDIVETQLHGEYFIRNPFVKYNYKEEDGYHLLDTIPVDFVKEFGKDKQVLYKYNQEWFRSDNFKQDHDGLHIVFSGCSNTEGVGANIEDTWSHMLYSELSKTHKLDGYFNLSRSGSGWHTIIQNYTTYVAKYGAADYLFILMPNILRDWVWYEDKRGWVYTQTNPWSGSNEEVAKNRKEHRTAFPTWLISWKLFMKYCESVGTKVLWSTWDYWETDNIINTKQKEYFPINVIQSDIIKTDEYMKLLERDDAVWARDGHDGYIQQHFWFKAFLNAINERDFIK